MTERHSPLLPDEPRFNLFWLPLLVGGLLCALVVIFWLSLRERELSTQHLLVRSEAEKLLSHIEADMRSRVPALSRIVKRWEIRGGTPRDEFESDAMAYVRDMPGFQALEWVDDSYHIRWVVPLAGNEQAVDLDLTFEETRRLALERARHNDEPSMTSPVDLVQGGKGFLIYFTITNQGVFNGFLLAVFNIKDWLEYVFQLNETAEELENYRVRVTISGKDAYQQPGWEEEAFLSHQATIESRILGHQFTLSCRPTRMFFQANSTWLSSLALFVGLVLSAMVSFVVLLYQKAAAEAWRTHAARGALIKAVEDQKDTADELRHTTTRLTLATSAGGVGVWEWDIDTDQLAWDRHMFDLYMVPTDMLPTYEIWRDRVHPEDVERVEKELRLLMEGRAPFDTEFRIVTPGGGQRFIHAAASLERDGNNAPIRMIGVNWDITEQKTIEKTIRHLATHDPLTDLPTLRLAKDRMAMAMASARRGNRLIGVMFLDLDGFKDVNDTYGHDAGDSVLKETARRLTSCVRESDTVARIGGDEFLIILSELHMPEDASLVAQSILNAMAAPFLFNVDHLSLGVSIGITTCGRECRNGEELIRQADQAMYSIKQKSKNDYAYYKDIV